MVSKVSNNDIEFDDRSDIEFDDRSDIEFDDNFDVDRILDFAKNNRPTKEEIDEGKRKLKEFIENNSKD